MVDIIVVDLEVVLKCRVGGSEDWIEVTAVKYCFYGLFICCW